MGIKRAFRKKGSFFINSLQNIKYVLYYNNVNIYLKIKDFTMITPEKIDRINFLARKSREQGLTEEEKIEQKALRAEYVASVRANLRAQLDNVTVERPDGTVESLKEAAKNKK